MDIFKQKRYLVLIIVLLVILNLVTILMLWLNKPSEQFSHREELGPEQKRKHIQQLLKDELDFDDAQIEQYLTMRKEQSERVSVIHNEIRQIKKQMFDEVLKNVSQPVLSDSLLKLSQDKMVELEELTFQYLLDLKNLCRPDQQYNLKLLIDEFFRHNSPREMKNDMPPPPPGDEAPPLRY
jgi:hypothetical protein